MAQLVLARRRGTYLTLDDPLTLAQAVEDPEGLVAQGRGLTVIDEVQRAPDVLRAIKLAVDPSVRGEAGGRAPFLLPRGRRA